MSLSYFHSRAAECAGCCILNKNIQKIQYAELIRIDNRIAMTDALAAAIELILTIISRRPWKEREREGGQYYIYVYAICIWYVYMVHMYMVYCRRSICIL